MRSHANAIHSFGAKVREAINVPMRKFMAAMGSIYTSALVMMPTYCNNSGISVNTSVSMDSIFNGMVAIIIKIALYVGLLIALGGVFSLVMAYKNDDPDGQSRAIRYIVIGIILVGFRTVLSLTGLI